jgi:hypothetical protein
VDFLHDTWAENLLPEAIRQDFDDAQLVEIMAHLVTNTLEEMTETGTGASLANDLINAALAEVNAREIAHALIEWGTVEDKRAQHAEDTDYDNRPTLITD